MTLEEAFRLLGQFPHCDARILHRPTTCTYCDTHPEWQAYRIAMGINFTGETDSDKAPCPSQRFRPHQVAHQWHGNRPTNRKLTEADLTEPVPRTVFERLADDECGDE